MDCNRRGIASLSDDEVTLNVLDDCAEHMRGAKRLKENASTKEELGKTKLDFGASRTVRVIAYYTW